MSKDVGLHQSTAPGHIAPMHSIAARQSLRSVFHAIMVIFLLFAFNGDNAIAVERQATVYKNPQCGCCNEYIGYLRRHGFKVKTIDTPNISPVKQQYGVPLHLESCHTTLIDGYVIEGHVPVKSIARLLSERPKIKGIALPRMPAGSPGMNGRKTEPFVIYEIADGTPRVYATE